MQRATRTNSLSLPPEVREASIYPGVQDPAEQRAWMRLWNRIPADDAARAAAIFSLQRSTGKNANPDSILIRATINGDRVAAAVNGANNLVWQWDTLSIVTGVRARVQQVTANPLDTAFRFLVSIGVGSDGGFVFGSTTNPTPLTAIESINGDVLPIPLPPLEARPNNQWTGTLTGAGLAGTPVVDINLYGISLWTPQGQIQ